MGEARHKETSRADVLLYVQHLLGIGHLRRAAVLSKALAAQGLKVVFVSGGQAVPHLDFGPVRFVQLPPIKSVDESFTLLDSEGHPIDQSFKDARRDQLLALYREIRPKSLLIELFPFGRRQVRFELLPLLEAARADSPAPKVICSLRDILTQQKKPEKLRWMIDCFERFFDLAIVHGDPRFITLDQTFPQARALADRLRYSGYVVDVPSGLPSEPRSGEVIVSAGGGAVAGPLLRACLAARALSSLADAPWRVLIGHNFPDGDFAAYAANAPTGMIVERARPDFHQLLARGALSISQGGYNTVLELMALGIPSVVVPFAAGAESEQSFRTRRLAERGLLTMVAEKDLTPQRLAQAIDHQAAQEKAPPLTLDCDGARNTALILRDLIGETAR